MKGVSLHSVDHWPEIEIDQLRDDLECAEQAQLEAVTKMEATAKVARRNKRDFNGLKKTMDDKIAESNGELTRKSLVYLSLINEYEIILNKYASNSMVKLTTTSINQLRKRGGLIP
ncbi:MAG: hypothetical protein JRE23_03390 [Deltaproteobacteria bacterium]|nr:hypothetical protein [Deltaproteobacteria bacterium]